MLFNSVEFLLFLPAVFLLYWFVFKKIKSQNLFILFASYLFYGWWDWRFLFLILASTLVDYYIGIMLLKTSEYKKRKLLLSLSLFFNIGLLVVFKYYNFFIDNWIYAWDSLGITMHKSSLNIILPVGISFYTFQTLSYTIDVYRKNLKGTTNFIAFASFVSFFPQLVAGPIERAGMKLILWGLVKKVIIADNCAPIVNDVFDNYQNESGLTLVFGAIYFAFQIYGDFSGYSDIAIGTSRIFGFNLKLNFNYPYFSRDIAEFWRRWHISLSTWFRDYLYIPVDDICDSGLTIKQIRNVFIIFLVSGFWHGANWTFVFWGLLNALFFLPIFLSKKNRSNLNIVAEHNIYPSLKEFFYMLITFILTCLAWIVFRSENIFDAFNYILNIFDITNFIPEIIRHKKFLPVLLLFIIVEWFSRKSQIVILLNGRFRYFFYILFIFTILYFSSTENQTSFIYFQF